VKFYRQDEHLEFVTASEWFPGNKAPEPPTAVDRTRDWNWPAYHFVIPDNWPSAVYVAFLIEGCEARPLLEPEDPPVVDSREARALFVVKSPAPGRHAGILYNLPLFTYQAYNYTGRINFYMKGDPPDSDRVHRVTLRRPGAGTGGAIGGEYEDHCGSACDWYDETSPRNTFAHWDALFISWLSASGYDVDYCTDVDLHDGTAALASYRLLLCVGHHEYWSTEMRDSVEAFVRGGGNIAWLSGNTCWWRVRYHRESAQLECRKIDNRDLWWSGAKRPENSLTGVSFQNGGGWWGGEAREALGFTVQHADSWVFEGTGLKNGDTFGRDAALVGFECDGASVTGASLPGRPLTPDGRDGTPRSFQILGWAQLTRFGNGVTGWWNEGPSPSEGQIRLATMGFFTNGGTVFNAATTDWVRVVVKARDSHAIRITHNVLRRLSGRYEPGQLSRFFDAVSLRLVSATVALLALLRVPTTRRSCMVGGVAGLLGAVRRALAKITKYCDAGPIP
jgi:hypothetical protein